MFWRPLSSEKIQKHGSSEKNSRKEQIGELSRERTARVFDNPTAFSSPVNLSTLISRHNRSKDYKKLLDKYSDSQMLMLKLLLNIIYGYELFPYSLNK